MGPYLKEVGAFFFYRGPMKILLALVYFLFGSPDIPVSGVPQDTLQGAVQFQWQAYSDVSAWDSVHYRIVVDQAGSTVFDSVFAHPDDTYIWEGGVENQSYSVTAEGIGYAQDQPLSEGPSDPTAFTVPGDLPIPARLQSVVVKSIWVGTDTIP